jgi:hypothetical protein
MPEVLDFSALPDPDAIREATAAGKEIACGWLPPHERTAAMNKADEAAQLSFSPFNIRGRFSAAERRYPLWKAGKILTGKFLRYNWQTTGSCVGAGGDNALKTLLACQIVLKGLNQELRDVFWPFAYGRSRFRGGIRGRGEGSFGSAWAKAILEDGFLPDDGEGGDLHDFTVRDNWLVLPAKTEMDWSDGARIAEKWLKIGREYPVRTVARMKSKHDCFEAIAHGYPLTQASSFGFSGAKVQGSEFPIRVATWNGTWHHQTFIDEVWDHPELRGIYFRWPNNWGPDAHGKPTGDEPPGGVYIHEDTMDRLCKEGEVYALSDAEGFPAQELNFSAL